MKGKLDMGKLKSILKDKLPKELPAVVVNKAYNDSLNLYNTSLGMAKNMANALAKGFYDNNIKYGVSKSVLDREYKKNIEYYNKQLVEPITKGRKPNFGRINKYNKKLEASINKYLKEEGDYYRKGLSSNDYQTKYVSGEYIKGYEKLAKLNNKIKPIAYSEAAELPSIPIYKKPTKPTEKTKVEPKKEQPTKKTEQPKPIEKKKNVYEGSPVYSPGIGSGMPSALIGFTSKSGDTVMVKPEDYERFAVPKHAQAYIESKKQKQ